MKKMCLFLLTLIMTFAMTVSAQPVFPVTRIIPEDAQWVVHLDVQKFAATEIGNWIKTDKFRKFEKFNTMLRDKIKVDLLRDLTGVTAIGLGHGERETVVVIQGKMDKNHLLGFLDLSPNHTKASYGKYTLHTWKDSEAGVFVNDSMLLIGRNEILIKHVLDVIDGKQKNMTASSLSTYWREIPKDAFLSAAAANISDLVHSHEASVVLKKTGMALFLALEKNEILKLALKLNTDSPETAKNIHQLVMGFVALGKMKVQDQNQKHHKLFELLENLNVDLAGNVLQFELTYPSKELLEMTNPVMHHEHE